MNQTPHKENSNVVSSFLDVCYLLGGGEEEGGEHYCLPVDHYSTLRRLVPLAPLI